jgi:hypothetical protein
MPRGDDDTTRRREARCAARGGERRARCLGRPGAATIAKVLFGVFLAIFAILVVLTALGVWILA